MNLSAADSVHGRRAHSTPQIKLADNGMRRTRFCEPRLNFSRMIADATCDDHLDVTIDISGDAIDSVLRA